MLAGLLAHRASEYQTSGDEESLPANRFNVNRTIGANPDSKEVLSDFDQFKNQSPDQEFFNYSEEEKDLTDKRQTYG